MHAFLKPGYTTTSIKSIEELPGTTVLVKASHRVGVITETPPEPDGVIVAFNQQERVLFSTASLLVMREPGEIETDAQNDFTLLAREDYNDIMEILLFAGSSRAEERQAAMELSARNPIAMEYTTQPLNNIVGLRLQLRSQPLK